MVSIHAIQQKIAEALLTDDKMTLETLYKKLAEAVGMEVSTLKAVLSGKVQGTEETLKKLGETLEVKEEVVATPPGKDDKPVTETKDALKIALEQTFDSNTMDNKVKELQKLIESNSDADAKKWVGEITKKILEIVSLNSENNSVVQKYHAALKEVNTKLSEVTDKFSKAEKTIGELQTELKATKGLSETLKKVVGEKVGGKGIFETKSGPGVKNELSETKEGPFAKGFNDMSLSEIVNLPSQ